jgi:hypothetical protein
MLTRTQALEGGANVTCISKVKFTYRSFIRLTILATTLLHGRTQFLGHNRSEVQSRTCHVKSRDLVVMICLQGRKHMRVGRM